MVVADYMRIDGVLIGELLSKFKINNGPCKINQVKLSNDSPHWRLVNIS